MLEAAGSSLSKTIKVNIFLSSLDYYGDVNKAYGEAFTSDPRPVSIRRVLYLSCKELITFIVPDVCIRCKIAAGR